MEEGDDFADLDRADALLDEGLRHVADNGLQLHRAEAHAGMLRLPARHQAVAGRARGGAEETLAQRFELRQHRSVWADLQETSHVPHLALRVFDGHLCITQHFLYGAKPDADVINFAQALSTEAQRLGAARGHAFGVTPTTPKPRCM